MMRDKFAGREHLLHEVPTREQEKHDRRSRQQVLLTVAQHASSAVDFVEMVGALGLEAELEERLQARPELQTAVTEARRASPYASVLTIEEEI